MLSITRWLPRRQDETQGGQRAEVGGVGDDSVPRKGVGRGTGSRLGRWLSNRDVENQQGPPRPGGNRADTGHGSSQRPSRCSARVLCPGHHRPSGPPLSVSHTEAAWFKKISCHFKLLFSTVFSSQETREEDAEISDTLSSPHTLGCPRRQHPPPERATCHTNEPMSARHCHPEFSASIRVTLGAGRPVGLDRCVTARVHGDRDTRRSRPPSESSVPHPLLPPLALRPPWSLGPSPASSLPGRRGGGVAQPSGAGPLAQSRAPRVPPCVARLDSPFLFPC